MFSDNNFLIVDDEQHCVDVLVYELERLDLGISNIYSTTSSEEAIELITTVRPSLTFLDIDMPIYSGFDIVERAADLGPFIVTTAYERYAIQAFKAHAINFLLKPVNQEELSRALDHYVKLGTSSCPDLTALSKCQLQYLAARQMCSIVVPDASGVRICKLDEICALSANGAYTVLQMNDLSTIMSSKHLGFYEDCLPLDRFIRIHRKYIINLDKISKIDKRDGGSIVLSNGVTFPVSRLKMKTLKDYFGI